MTPDQAPESCPFCGAGPITEGEGVWCREIGKYQCGTIFHAYRGNRDWQPKSCATAERESLTRDRDDLATKATALAVQVAELTRELEGHAHDLSPAMVQARNDQLAEENANLRARIKRLERLVDGVHYIDGVHLEELDGLSWFDARTAAKEDKP